MLWHFEVAKNYENQILNSPKSSYQSSVHPRNSSANKPNNIFRCDQSPKCYGTLKLPKNHENKF